MGNRALTGFVQDQLAMEDPPWLKSEDGLIHFLESNGVSTAAFGTGSAKSVTHLLHELRSQACFLELRDPEDGQGAQPQVLRVVEPVFIRLCWRSHVLVQEEQVFSDGRRRTRKMLLAEKKEPCDGGGLFATVVRALHEELGLETEALQQEGVLQYRLDAYHFELEQIDSPSYPGLASMYRTHHVQVDIPEASHGVFAGCGIPGCNDFVTCETSEAGTTTHFWRWYDTAKALRENVVKFPPQVLSTSSLACPGEGAGGAVGTPDWRALTKQEIGNTEDLSRFLKLADIDPTRYGVGKAKTIDALLKEVQKGESTLEWQDHSQSMRRIAEPVFIQFRWRGHVLVEAEQRFDDGRVRQRNMLLAEKKSPEDADVRVTALRGLREELDLPEEFPALDGIIHFMQETYCCVAENLESSSYPGLTCVYVTHYCAVQIMDAAVPHFQALGMLEDEFETKEYDKVNRWRWTPLEVAKQSKVKGFPDLKELKNTSDDKQVVFEPLTSVPLDEARLRVLLEVGGVNVRAWGDFAPASLRSLAKEVKSGAAQLERDMSTGKIRRVLQSNLVQMVVEDAQDGTVSDYMQRYTSEADSGPETPVVTASGASSTFGREEARGLVHFRPDLACFEVVHADTAAYPGLPCCHQTRLVQFDQRNALLGKSASGDQEATAEEYEPISPKSMGCNSSGADSMTPSETAGLRRSATSTYPRLLDDVFVSRRGSRNTVGGSLPPGDAFKRTTVAANRGASVVSKDDGLPVPNRGSLVSLPEPSGDTSPCTPKRRSLYRQVRNLQKNLRFRMVANEGLQSETKPAEQPVACSCDILLIRNINPLNATYYCRFQIFVEWIDPAAVGLPLGEVSADKRKELNVPEIALQNTLATNLEIHSPPEVVNPETGHVACKVLFQALMQMELDMRLFPFDQQRLVLVLGLRARRDRNRAIFTQFCNLDRQIKLDEWRLTSSFMHSDRPDGRARVQFGVVISRAYWYYLLNVLGTLVGIASMSLVAFLLQVNPPFDRLRFGVAVLFAQTTFRLSIDNKLPKVSYSTIFDQYAIFCQLLVLTIMVFNAFTSRLDLDLAEMLDTVFLVLLSSVWVFGNVAFVLHVLRQRARVRQALQRSEQEGSDAAGPATAPDFTAEAQQQMDALKAGLQFRGPRRASTEATGQTSVRAVTVVTHIWLIHDVDPLSATFECKFSVHLEWLHAGAEGLPAGSRLTLEQLKAFDLPEIDVHNKVELALEEGPVGHVVDSASGQIMVSCRYHARLQIHLNLRRFPFDSQRLPINLTMPGTKDRDRAFVFRTCHLAQTAQHLDEWIVQGLDSSTDYTDGIALASLEVCIQRRSMYYVVSVLLVLLGISSLVFTVFVIDVDSSGNGFADQGKILVPLLMTTLAFKLLIASGKIPKAAYATIFDRIMLACEALFFLTISICSITFILTRGEQTAASAPAFRTHAAVVLLTAWILHGALIVVELRCGREPGGARRSARLGLSRSSSSIRTSQSFEQQSIRLTRRACLAGLGLAVPAPEPSAVLLRIKIEQVHSVNPTTGSFVCEFVATLAWLNAGVKELLAGAELSAEQLKELGQPAMTVQNSLSCKAQVRSGFVVDPEKGHVTCQVHYRAQVLMQFDLGRFPFDRQTLAVVLTFLGPMDQNRQLVLEGCENSNAVKISEWSVLGTFASPSPGDGLPQVVFGVTIQRFSRYYVASLMSLCLWSTFVFNIYTLDVAEYQDRGKILVGVLLVQVVGKLAVSSKLPRIARTTAYDKVALNSLALNFGIGCNAAFWCLVGKLGNIGLTSEAIALLDQLLGLFLLLVWVLANARAIRSMLTPTNKNQRYPLKQAAEEPELAPEARRELAVLRQAERPFGGRAEAETLPGPLRTTTAPPEIAKLAVSLSIKVWMVSTIDVSFGTFECKFHAFLDWFEPAAVGLEEGTRIGVQGGRLDCPRLVARNAISVISEDGSDIEVKNSGNGHVSRRVQYHIKVYQSFNLRSFPFDCQRLEVALQLNNCPDRFLLCEQCLADDQTTNLDGWRLVALSNRQLEVASRESSVFMLVERESLYYIINVLAIFFFVTTLLFSFYLMKPTEFVKRLVDLLKIVLTQTTFRFSVEHRLPKVQHWTPFDIYVVSCQALCCFVTVSFIYSVVASNNPLLVCATQESERYVLLCLVAAWLLWNVACAGQARRVKRRELRACKQDMFDDEPLDFDNEPSSRRTSKDSKDSVDSLAVSRKVLRASTASLRSTKPWEVGALESNASAGGLSPQVISVAFRIWLVRNVDLVTATFECKFRVFLEWLDEDAIGLPKGKKAKLPVPEIAITNAVQSQVLDKSSAPEVVNSESGHLAVQILYRATLRMDQEVRHFPFDCQWLAITVSLRDAGAERSRSFMFQYCEVDGQLQLDEWQVHGEPAFSTLTKHDAKSIQDTVMCGVLIRRCARYYVVNILGMLGLITSTVFCIYTIDVRMFWERAEVFLGIFPLTVIFKMSAQGKLPRVGYSTKFDHYASSCQILFLAIVLGCMVASIATNLPQWLAKCPAPDYQESVVVLVRSIEFYFSLALLFLWLTWNVYFTVQAIRVQRKEPIDALRTPVSIRLQDKEHVQRCSSAQPVVMGLAPRLTEVANQEKSLEAEYDTSEAVL